MLNVKDARQELKKKSERQIDTETAWKWASRAVAAYEFFREKRSLKWLLAAAGYEHEAIEHAAEGGALVLTQVKRAIDEAKTRLGVDFSS